MSSVENIDNFRKPQVAAALQKIDETPFACLHAVDGARELWIIFSHVNIPEGKFAQSRVTEGIDAHRLFLNCARNDWYQSGVPGLADSLDGLLAWLQEFAASLDVDRIVCLGHSMGGYMAILFGHLLPNATFLATTPELELMQPLSRSKLNNVQPKKGWSDIRQRLAELDIDRNRGWVIYGAFDPIDAHFLSRHEEFGGLAGKVFEAPHHHGVTEFLTMHRVYATLLENLSDAAFAQLVQQGYLVPPQTFGTAEEYSYFYETCIAFKEGSDVLDRLRNHAQWQNAGWQNLRAQVFAANGCLDEWLESARTSFLLAENILEYAVDYGEAMIATGQFDGLSRVLGRLERRYSSHPVAQQFLAKLPEDALARGNRDARAGGGAAVAATCLPNLFLPGWQLCGTSDLVKLLQDHHQVFIPRDSEPGFMNRPLDTLTDAAAKYFQDYAKSGDFKYRCDATPTYFWHRRDDDGNKYRAYDNPKSLPNRNWSVPEAIQSHADEDSKFVIVLRNPVSRAISAYMRTFSKGLHDGSQSILDLGRANGLIDVGFFDKTYEHWSRFFRPEQFHFIQYDALLEAPEREVADLCHFLNITPLTNVPRLKPQFGLPLRAYDSFIGYDFERIASNKKSGSNISGGVLDKPLVTLSDVQQLNMMYRDSLAAIEDATGWNLASWRTNDLKSLLYQ